MPERGFVECKVCGVRMTARKKRTRTWVLYAKPKTTDWDSVRIPCVTETSEAEARYNVPWRRSLRRSSNS